MSDGVSSDEASDDVSESAGMVLVGVVEEDSWCVWGCKSMTVDEVWACLESNAKLREVSINIIAVPTVTLLRKVPGPRLPNTV